MEDEDGAPVMSSYMPTYVRSLSDQKSVEAPPIPHVNSSTDEVDEQRSLPSVERMLAEIKEVKTGKPLRSSSGVTWTSIDVMGRSMYFERVGGLKTGNISSVEALEDSKKMSEYVRFCCLLMKYMYSDIYDKMHQAPRFKQRRGSY